MSLFLFRFTKLFKRILMIPLCVKNLEQIEDLLGKIPQEAYTFRSQMLSNVSIGQHIRHLLEFYICVLQGIENRTVCYDNRKRVLLWETSKQEALLAAKKVIDSLKSLQYIENQHIEVEGNFSYEEKTTLKLASSLFRELAYCLEHSTHHQALIKVSLIEQRLNHLIGDEFGIASSTIRYLNGKNYTKI